MSIAVSVIVPIFKTPLNYLKECLNSLTAQTLQETEFLLIFDGEDKVLFKICEEYKTNDRRFHLFIQPHQGVSATRNYGIKQARGEYITFVDADDWIDKDCCKKTYNFALQNNSEIVLFDYNPTNNSFSKKNYAQNNIHSLSEKQVKELLQETILTTNDRFIPAVSTWCKLFKATLLKENHIFFPENCKKSVDRPFSFSAFLFAKKISFLKETLYNYNKVEGSISNTFQPNFLSIALTYLVEIKKISSQFNPLIAKQTIQYFYSSWGKYYFCKKNTKPLKIKIADLCNIIKAPFFQDLIEDIDYSKLSLLIKSEVILFKHKITFPIHLHAIKWFIFKR